MNNNLDSFWHKMSLFSAKWKMYFDMQKHFFHFFFMWIIITDSCIWYPLSQYMIINDVRFIHPLVFNITAKLSWTVVLMICNGPVSHFFCLFLHLSLPLQKKLLQPMRMKCRRLMCHRQAKVLLTKMPLDQWCWRWVCCALFTRLHWLYWTHTRKIQAWTMYRRQSDSECLFVFVITKSCVKNLAASWCLNLQIPPSCCWI